MSGRGPEQLKRNAMPAPQTKEVTCAVAAMGISLARQWEKERQSSQSLKTIWMQNPGLSQVHGTDGSQGPTGVY